MKLTKVTFKKESFDMIPENERTLIVQLSIFANEITMLHKFIVFSNNYKDDEAILTAQNVQSFFLIKLLAGKLYEGWNLLQEGYFKSKLSQQYDPLLLEDGREALEYIKSYFGKKNIIHLIRHKYSFHYDHDEIKKQLSEIPEGAVLDQYLAPDHGNSLYAFGHIISSYALFREIDSSDDIKALDTIFTDVLGVASKYLSFTADVLGKIWEKYRIPIDPLEHYIFVGVPDIKSIKLPYFVSRK